MSEIYDIESMYYFANGKDNPTGELVIYGECNRGIGSIAVSFYGCDGKGGKYKARFLGRQEGTPRDMMRQFREKKRESLKDIIITTESINVGKNIEETLHPLIERYGYFYGRAYKIKQEAAAIIEEREMAKFLSLMRNVRL